MKEIICIVGAIILCCALIFVPKMYWESKIIDASCFVDLTEEEIQAVNLANKAITTKEVMEIIAKYDFEKLQVPLAYGSTISQTTLLQQEKLTNRALLIICEFPNNELNSVKKGIYQAISKANLSIEEENKILNLYKRDTKAHLALLNNPNLNVETLISIIEMNNKIFSPISFKNITVKNLITHHIINQDFTMEQLDKLASFNISVVNKALIERGRLVLTENVSNNT